MLGEQEVIWTETYHVDDVEGDEGAFGAREGPAHIEAGVVWDGVTQEKKYDRIPFTESHNPEDCYAKLITNNEFLQTDKIW